MYRLLASFLAILTIGCNSPTSGITPEEQAMANTMGITVDEMRNLTEAELAEKMRTIMQEETQSGEL